MGNMGATVSRTKEALYRGRERIISLSLGLTSPRFPWGSYTTIEQRRETYNNYTRRSRCNSDIMIQRKDVNHVGRCNGLKGIVCIEQVNGGGNKGGRQIHVSYNTQSIIIIILSSVRDDNTGFRSCSIFMHLELKTESTC
ncbi:hypothetical protein EGW08_014094 [Elysia chlorotica]|uniref:Uncharacterized protein n=1 Tax=Elysia chlorotica TaxID=188477 RepID=A0A433T9C7_ELYCH|nr:hypothetical protein EGW08_014094 [Elysia chlorotica]